MSADQIQGDLISILEWVYSVGLGLLGHIFMNLGQGLQKTGVQGRYNSFLKGEEKSVKHRLIWLSGFVMSGIGVVMFFYALADGHTPTLASLSGFGLGALTIYSQIVLKEKIGLFEYLALLFIVLGTIFVNLAMVEDVPKAIAPDPVSFWATMGSLVLIAGLLFAFASIKKPVSRAAFYGVAAGILGGCEMLSQKATTIYVNKSLLFQGYSKTFSLFDVDSCLIYVKLPEFWFSWLFMLASFLTMQIGYRYGRAVTIVPSFSSLYIITPFIGSILLFDEKLVHFQWIGIILILIGVVNLSRLERTHLNAIDNYMHRKR